MVSYEGIDEATLIHALYHGTQPLGMGVFQDIPDLSLERVKQELDSAYKRPVGGIPHLDHPNEEYDGRIHFDYYHGRPLKLLLDTKAKTFEERFYDRDAGPGAAKEIVDRLRELAKIEG